MDVEDAPGGPEPSTLPEVSTQSLDDLRGGGCSLGTAPPVGLKFEACKKKNWSRGSRGQLHPAPANTQRGVER